MERRLQRLSWLTFQKLVPVSIDTVIFPVGTIEGHGSSCLGTDNFIPETIADGIAERLNALIAPTVNYGVTRSLYRYPGGSTVRPDHFQAYIRDILDSFADHSFKNVILLNGHGGNNQYLKEVALEFHQQQKKNIAVIHWWELCAEMTDQFFGHPGGHAGTDETAMVLAVDPALADSKTYDKDLAWHFKPGSDIYPVPGSILLYKEGEGYPEFDVEKSLAYREKVVEVVGEFVETIISRWKKFGL